MKPELTNSVVLPAKTAQSIKANPVAITGSSGAPIAGPITTVAGAEVGRAAANTGLNEDAASELKAVVEKLNLDTSSIGRSLRFQFDDEANTSVIKVYDRETEQLIRQIPSEEALNRLRQANDDVFQLIDTEA